MRGIVSRPWLSPSRRNAARLCTGDEMWIDADDPATEPYLYSESGRGSPHLSKISSGPIKEDGKAINDRCATSHQNAPGAGTVRRGGWRVRWGATVARGFARLAGRNVFDEIGLRRVCDKFAFEKRRAMSRGGGVEVRGAGEGANSRVGGCGCSLWGNGGKKGSAERIS